MNDPVDNVHGRPLPLSHVTRARHQRKRSKRVALCRGGRVRGRGAALRAHMGQVVAPNGQRFRVWSTPKDADVAARIIRRFVLSNREG